MVRVGLVGFGMSGRVFHAPLISSVDGLELAAIVERTSNRAVERYPKVPICRTVEELLADSTIKLVVVATPNDSHLPVALQAIEAARSVVVDKPVGLTAAEIQQLDEFAGGIGTQCIPFHNRRWDSDFRTIQKLLHEGTLGHLIQFESYFDRWRPGTSSRAWKDEPLQGGILQDIGTHLVDQALLLFGLPISLGAEVLRERDGAGANDSFTLRLYYFNGLAVTLGANLLSSLPRPRFRIRGWKGNFCKWGLDPQEEALNKITSISDPNWGQEPAANWGTLNVDIDGGIVTRPVAAIPGDYRLFYAGVRDAVEGKSASPVPAIDAIRAAKVLELALQSAEQQRDVECLWSEPDGASS